MNGSVPAPTQVTHIWSKDALFAKAIRFAQEMCLHNRDDWRFAFWSTHVLELLARAALAHVSPTLLADPKEANNLVYALGLQPTAKKFVPKSLDLTSVFSMLRQLLPTAFDSRLEGYALQHVARRNEELHSGSEPFDGVSVSTWLPGYCEACDVLVTSIGESLEVLFGEEEATTARAMIEAARDESAKAVKGAVNAHQVVWLGREPEERAILAAHAVTLADRKTGHRVVCPACECAALVVGAPTAAASKILKGDDIVITQQYLPSKFECTACGLKISGLPQLHACGLGEPFKATFTYEASAFYAPDEEEDLGPEPDYND